MNIFLFIFVICLSTLNAANWLIIQGTEKKPGTHPWGFIQVKVENNEGNTLIKNGINKTPFSYIRPTLQNQAELQLSRLRLGIRGSFDDANNVNYFVLTELAQNGVNNPLGTYTPTYLTDASITLKYLPIYIRAGKFKYAGSEEGNMARFTSPFINFTSVSNQLMLERFVESRAGKPTQGVGAYRDTGIQLFKTFNLDDDSELSFAYMLGNGSGTQNYNVNANNFTHYGFVSYEGILGGGKGYRQESYKLYAWFQSGKRLFENELYDRERYGLGMTYFYNDLRVEAEYMAGSGMVVGGVKDRDTNAGNSDWVYSMNPEFKNKAEGFYVASTYRLFEPFEVLARYDQYNRLTNSDVLYRKFETITTGVSYIFSNYNRVDINYAFDTIAAPKNSAADAFLDTTVGNLLSIQLTMVFK